MRRATGRGHGFLAFGCQSARPRAIPRGGSPWHTVVRLTTGGIYLDSQSSRVCCASPRNPGCFSGDLTDSPRIRGKSPQHTTCRPSTSSSAKAARPLVTRRRRPPSSRARRSAAFACASTRRPRRSRTRRSARSAACASPTAWKSPPTSRARATTSRSTRSCSSAAAA